MAVAALRAVFSVVLGLVLLHSGVVQGQQYQFEHCLFGCPTGASSENHLLARSIYTLSYNTSLKTAQWVAYEVSAGAIGVASGLSRQPIADDYIADTLTQGDFLASEGSGFIRAHYVPLVSFAGTPYWSDVNYLTNVVARSNSLSQGAWYGLDWAIRNLVNREGAIYVVTGPVFHEDAAPKRLNTSKAHRIPDAFFKVVLTSEGKAAAFLLPQDTAVHVHHCDLQASVEEIERLTGLDLFPERRAQLDISLQTSLGCFES